MTPNDVLLIPLIAMMLIGTFIGWVSRLREHRRDIADMEALYNSAIADLESQYNEEIRRQQIAYEKRHSAALQMSREATLAAQEWHDDWETAINQRNELLEQLTDLQNSFRRDNADTITVGLN
jgi:hypothetical protein